MIRRVLAIALLTVGFTACDGDSTPAAGRCIVAFQAAARAVETLEDADEQAFESAIVRTLYWCVDEQQWGAGRQRIIPEGTEADERFSVRELLGFICDGPYRDTPVCKDAISRGPLPNPFEGSS